MCGTSKVDPFMRYNFRGKYFFPRSIFMEIKSEKLDEKIFLLLNLKIKFAGILITIFVIRVSKYVNVGNLKSEGSPIRNCTFNGFWKFFLISFFLKNNSLGQKCIEH